MPGGRRLDDTSPRSISSTMYLQAEYSRILAIPLARLPTSRTGRSMKCLCRTIYSAAPILWAPVSLVLSIKVCWDAGKNQQNPLSASKEKRKTQAQTQAVVEVETMRDTQATSEVKLVFHMAVGPSESAVALSLFNSVWKINRFGLMGIRTGITAFNRSKLNSLVTVGPVVSARSPQNLVLGFGVLFFIIDLGVFVPCVIGLLEPRR
ncbi:hypothetical protein R3P38DRAFT_1354021 [Favolaschia claudopus]|uniref:Uncharacterized protein n=1 Tax=Favolaschia claudopus TaxID=2862362 RepID=A0AAW0DRQ0_9AGAR